MCVSKQPINCHHSSALARHPNGTDCCWVFLPSLLCCCLSPLPDFTRATRAWPCILLIPGSSYTLMASSECWVCLTLYCYSVSGDSTEWQGSRPIERGPLPVYVHSTDSARSCVTLLPQILHLQHLVAGQLHTYVGEQLVVQDFIVFLLLSVPVSTTVHNLALNYRQ